MNNTPDYYRLEGIGDVADVIEAAGFGRGFRLGNVLKYVLRAGKKCSDGETERASALIDLRKARNYLDKEIEVIIASIAEGASHEGR